VRMFQYINDPIVHLQPSSATAARYTVQNSWRGELIAATLRIRHDSSTSGTTSSQVQGLKKLDCEI
jgi:hypothetical protein